MFDLQAVALDIDGTLLNSDDIITPKTYDYLHQLQDQGVRLILASGRPTASMLEIAEHLHLDRSENYLLSYNGAEIVRVDTGERLSQKTLDTDLARRLLATMRDYEVVPMITQEGYLYTSQEELMVPGPTPTSEPINIIAYEASLGDFEIKVIPELHEWIDFPVNKLIFAGQPEDLQAHASAMSAPFLDETQSFFTAPHYYEFTHPQANKGKALHYLLTHTNLEGAKTVAFGDSGNDLSMLEYAGIGVAMGNAMPEIKAAADAITDSNDQDGIANYLEKLLDE